MSLKNCDDSTVPQRSGKGTAHSLWLYNQDIILTTGLGYNCGAAVETWHYACVPDRWSSVVIDGHAEHLPDAEVVKCPILSCPGVPETEPSVLKLRSDRRPNDSAIGHAEHLRDRWLSILYCHVVKFLKLNLVSSSCGQTGDPTTCSATGHTAVSTLCGDNTKVCGCRMVCSVPRTGPRH